MTDESRGSHDGSGARNSRGGHRSGGPSGGRGGGNAGRPRSGGARGSGSGHSGGFRGGRDGGGRGNSGGRGSGQFGRSSGGGSDRRDDRRGDREFRGGDRRRDDRRSDGRGDSRGDGRSGDRDRRFGGRPDRDRGDNRDRRDGRGRPQRGSGGGYGRQGGSGGRGRPGGEQREQREPREVGPAVDEDVTFEQLDPEIRGELTGLPKSLAEIVGRHMVMAGRLLDEEPERAYEHAVFARRRASRMGVVRESAGIAAYTVGKWQEALSDLRAARRMTGRDNFLAVIADCERGLGRPERALEIARDPAAAELPTEDRIELRIVAAGARRDLGQPEAAVVELQVPELKERRARPWVARLFYAYADALLEIGRRKDAREYFARASSVDRESLTDADERLAELEGVQIVDVGEDVVWTDAEDQFADEEPDASADSDTSAEGEDEVPKPSSEAEQTESPAEAEAPDAGDTPGTRNSESGSGA